MIFPVKRPKKFLHGGSLCGIFLSLFYTNPQCRNAVKRAVLFFAIMLTSPAVAQNDLKSALAQLDEALANRSDYIAGREQRIESLKNILHKSNFSNEQRYILNQQLIDEYAPYQADSTIDYLYSNIELARKLNDTGKLNESRISLAYLYSASGIYLEAATALQHVDSTTLDREQLVDYYIARHKLNDELQLYSHDLEQGAQSGKLTELYARLIVGNTEPESTVRLNYELWQAVRFRQLDHAAQLAEKICAKEPPLSREYASACYMRALVAELKHDIPTAQVWFARSATTDIKLAIRDNAALKNLAHTLLGNENIQRAMGYMRVVMDDARFFNSRLRPWQDALALHVIEEAYRERRGRMDTMYNIFVGSLVCFMLLAVAGVIFALRQNRKLRLARIELWRANNQLNVSNYNLTDINSRLTALNNQISEANTVKEEYIGIFLTMCSEYIDKLSDNRRNVRRLLRDGKIQEMRREYSSTEADERELDEFYRNFDTTFLKLYPTFIEELNALLDEESRIEPKKGELLTTELRIFALLRLGINDSSKIAALLRYSVSTIYNYRSKIKGHTLVSRDEFEERIKTIGAFNSQHL